MIIQRSNPTRRLLATFALAAASAASGASPALAQTPDITKTDWKAVVLADPKLKKPTGETPLNGVYPYIAFQREPQGYAIFDSVKYGDLTGDGKPEAVMPVASGGTAGDIGALVYRLNARGKPELATAVTGYKMSASIANTELFVNQAEYAGFEPNCCPSAISTTRYKLRGNALRRVGREVSPLPEARAVTLTEFFDRVNAKDYRGAYAFMSPAAQKRAPFATWVREFAGIKEIQLDGVTNSTSARVIAFLRATAERGPIRTAPEVTMVWSARARHWQIEAISGNELPEKAAVIAGALSFPSEGTPAMLVVARETRTGKVTKAEFEAGAGTYAIVVEPGTYTIVAYVRDDKAGSRNGGGYTAAVPCGLDASCTDHALIPVTIKAGEVNTSIDPGDWFADEGAMPPKP